MNAPTIAKTLSFAAGLSGLVALTGGVALHRNVQAWESVRAEATAVEGRLMEIPFGRDVLWGEAQSGAAMETYRSAAELVSPERLGFPGPAGLGELLAVLESAVDSTESVDLFASEPVEEALALLRLAAHQSDATPIRFPSLDDAHRPRLTSGRTLVLLARTHARSLSAQGEDLDAARWLLDATQLGIDYARSPVLVDRAIGTALVRCVFHGGTSDVMDVSFLGDAGLREIMGALPGIQRELRLLPSVGAADFVKFVEGIEDQLPDPVRGPLESFHAYGRCATLGSDYVEALNQMDAACAISAAEVERVSALLCDRIESGEIRQAVRTIRAVHTLAPDLHSDLDGLDVAIRAQLAPRPR